MKLKRYMKRNGISVREMTRLLGLRSRATVYGYLSGNRIPMHGVMLKIKAVTNGEISPNDWYADSVE